MNAYKVGDRVRIAIPDLSRWSASAHHLQGAPATVEKVKDDEVSKVLSGEGHTVYLVRFDEDIPRNDGGFAPGPITHFNVPEFELEAL